jgi:hypothetical protein
MRRLPAVFVVSLLVAVGFASAVIAFFVLPDRLVDDANFTNPRDAAAEEKRLAARHDVRTVGVQLVGALALIVGGALTWRTVWLTREGQITDRLANAVERLGEEEKVSKRLELDWRRGVDPEVRAVAMVLRARRAAWDPKAPGINFSAIDFRNAPLQGVDLSGADLRRSNFRGAFLSDADLSGARMNEVTLRAASLQRCKLDRAALTGGDLSYAHAERASLRGAALDEVVWESTDLCGADLSGASGVHEKFPASGLVEADARTRWPWERSPLWRRR